MFRFPKATYLLGGALILCAGLYTYWNLSAPSPQPPSPAKTVSSVRSSERHKVSKSASIAPSKPTLPTNSPKLAPQREQSLPSSQAPSPHQAVLPVDSSDTLKTFLAARQQLQKGHAKMMAGLKNATPEERTQALEKWHQEHATELAAQQELAVKMGAESRPARLPILAKPRIPENATPELREFLTARHDVMKDQMELMNQLSDAPPEQQHHAMEKWNKQNSTRLEAMQIAATKLSQSQPANPHP